jgi:hypothetical protein
LEGIQSTLISKTKSLENELRSNLEKEMNRMEQRLMKFVSEVSEPGKMNSGGWNTKRGEPNKAEDDHYHHHGQTLEPQKSFTKSSTISFAEPPIPPQDDAPQYRTLKKQQNKAEFPLSSINANKCAKCFEYL